MQNEANPAIEALYTAGMEFFRLGQWSEALGAFQKAEIGRWWPIIKAANIKGD